MEIVNTRGVNLYGGNPDVLGSRRVVSPISMKTGHEMHMKPGAPDPHPEGAAGGFASALRDALSGVEKIDNRAHQLTVQSVVDPDSVDAHSVVIAAEKARFALNLTKTVADGFIRTFKDLSSLR